MGFVNWTFLWTHRELWNQLSYRHYPKSCAMTMRSFQWHMLFNLLSNQSNLLEGSSSWSNVQNRTVYQTACNPLQGFHFHWSLIINWQNQPNFHQCRSIARAWTLQVYRVNTSFSQACFWFTPCMMMMMMMISFDIKPKKVPIIIAE